MFSVEVLVCGRALLAESETTHRLLGTSILIEWMMSGLGKVMYPLLLP